MILPVQAWLDAPATRAVVAALGGDGATVRAVGGAVRDALLGLPVNDVDLATVFEPAEVMRRLEAAGLRAVPTGVAHGTVTAVAHGVGIEVTTLRRDVTTDGRHAHVAFSTDWRDDAARRDFTINALYADPATREVADWFGGLDDLTARRVRFIGDPATRIAEDHLRVLRFFRFHARFGHGDPDAAGLAACAARANDLMALSRERIAAELSKLLAVTDPLPVVRAMLGARILAAVLPEAHDTDRLATLIAAEAAAHVAPEWLRRLAALLPADGGVLDDIAARLRLSNSARKRLVAMAQPPASDAAAEAYRDGSDAARDRRLLAGAPIDELTGWARPQLPIGGRTLIARGVPAGPAVARTLGAFEAAWIAAGFPTQSATVDGLIDDALAAVR